MNQKIIEDYLATLADVTEESVPDDNVILFKVNDKLVALLELTNPLKISLRCDPELAKLLREKYETIMPGQKLNNKHWNTILLSGQIDWLEIQGLIQLSYNLTLDQS